MSIKTRAVGWLRY